MRSYTEKERVYALSFKRLLLGMTQNIILESKIVYLELLLTIPPLYICIFISNKDNTHYLIRGESTMKCLGVTLFTNIPPHTLEVTTPRHICLYGLDFFPLKTLKTVTR